MMQKLRDPKNVKMISLFVAAIFVLGCFALTLTQSGVNSVASAASSESAIGVVNYQMLLSQVPDLQNVQTSMKQEIDNAQKDFDEKSKQARLSLKAVNPNRFRKERKSLKYGSLPVMKLGFKSLEEKMEQWMKEAKEK